MDHLLHDITADPGVIGFGAIFVAYFCLERVVKALADISATNKRILNTLEIIERQSREGFGR